MNKGVEMSPPDKNDDASSAGITIILVRHGLRKDYDDRLSPQNLRSIKVDEWLTERGEFQARWLARRLKRHLSETDMRVTHYGCSPFAEAVATLKCLEYERINIGTEDSKLSTLLEGLSALPENKQIQRRRGVENQGPREDRILSRLWDLKTEMKNESLVVLLVGHYPLLDYLFQRLQTTDSVSQAKLTYKKYGAIVLPLLGKQKNRLHADMDNKKLIWNVQWAPYIPDKSKLLSKISSKMAVCTFLGAFTAAILTLILQNNPLSAGTNLHTAVMPTYIVSLVTIAFAMFMFVWGLLRFDRLGTPREYWDIGKQTQHFSAQSWRAADERGGVYQGMVKTWLFVIIGLISSMVGLLCYAYTIFWVEHIFHRELSSRFR